jgi:hypothetical protein
MLSHSWFHDRAMDTDTLPRWPLLTLPSDIRDVSFVLATCISERRSRYLSALGLNGCLKVYVSAV